MIADMIGLVAFLCYFAWQVRSTGILTRNSAEQMRAIEDLREILVRTAAERRRSDDLYETLTSQLSSQESVNSVHEALSRIEEVAKATSEKAASVEVQHQSKERLIAEWAELMQKQGPNSHLRTALANRLRALRG